MRHALHLAGEMRGHVWPNPPVGCVIVKGGHVVAEATTQVGGRPHAERKALQQAGGEAKGATLYVTLEPCCHWGKTPPCADAIIEAGVSRVVCAIQDPDPRVNGGGFATLRAAGLDVGVGLCADEAERVMSGFFHRVHHGEPELVFVDQAQTEVPTYTDALLASSAQVPRLFTRRGEVDISQVPADRLLAWMGAFGLTSVAISKCDHLFPALAESQVTQNQTQTAASERSAVSVSR